MDDLLSEFLTETSEGLSTLDVELVKLEQNPNDTELLGNIFRLMHTIKGTCGFLGLPRLESVAHAGENILGKVRDGELVVTGPIVSLILECLDQIRDILNALEATEAEPEGDDSELIGRLNAAAEGKVGDAPAEAPAPAAAEAAVEEAPAAAEPVVEEAAAPAAEAEAVAEAPAEEPAPPKRPWKSRPPRLLPSLRLNLLRLRNPLLPLRPLHRRQPRRNPRTIRKWPRNPRSPTSRSASMWICSKTS